MLSGDVHQMWTLNLGAFKIRHPAKTSFENQSGAPFKVHIIRLVG